MTNKIRIEQMMTQTRYQFRLYDVLTVSISFYDELLYKPYSEVKLFCHQKLLEQNIAKYIKLYLKNQNEPKKETKNECDKNH